MLSCRILYSGLDVTCTGITLFLIGGGTIILVKNCFRKLNRDILKSGLLCNWPVIVELLVNGSYIVG